MNPDEDKIQFQSKIRKRGASYYLLIKPEIKDYLSLRDGSNTEIQIENGEYGPYISVWNPTQKEQKQTGEKQ